MKKTFRSIPVLALLFMCVSCEDQKNESAMIHWGSEKITVNKNLSVNITQNSEQYTYRFSCKQPALEVEIVSNGMLPVCVPLEMDDIKITATFEYNGKTYHSLQTENTAFLMYYGGIDEDGYTNMSFHDLLCASDDIVDTEDYLLGLHIKVK